MDSVIVYIGLGSNLDDPLRQIYNAYLALSNLAGTINHRLSPLYQSKAIGPSAQPDYINAAAELETTLSPIALLNDLQRIELDQNRIRTIHWGPRTIDLDILLYGDCTMSTPRLTVPHVFIKQRNFVLAPLLDLKPTLCLPDGFHVADLLKEAGDEGLSRLTASITHSATPQSSLSTELAR